MTDSDRKPKSARTVKPDRSDVEDAFRTIIRWTGDDADRDGLTETPARATRAFEEFFSGYGEDPEAILQKTFEEIEGYDVWWFCAEFASRAIVSITWPR